MKSLAEYGADSTRTEAMPSCTPLGTQAGTGTMIGSLGQAWAWTPIITASSYQTCLAMACHLPQVTHLHQLMLPVFLRYSSAPTPACRLNPPLHPPPDPSLPCPPPSPSRLFTPNTWLHVRAICPEPVCPSQLHRRPHCIMPSKCFQCNKKSLSMKTPCQCTFEAMPCSIGFTVHLC